jgi:hypothetical protein
MPMPPWPILASSLYPPKLRGKTSPAASPPGGPIEPEPARATGRSATSLVACPSRHWGQSPGATPGGSLLPHSGHVRTDDIAIISSRRQWKSDSAAQGYRLTVACPPHSSNPAALFASAQPEKTARKSCNSSSNSAAVRVVWATCSRSNSRYRRRNRWTATLTAPSVISSRAPASA